MRRVLSAAAVALLLALVALFVWQLAKDDNAFRDALRAGESPEAPAFALPRLDRRGRSRASLAGHATVLNFWASWCPPCADEAPDLNALSVRYAGLGVRFVGVDFNDAVDEARAFAKRHDVPYALVHDTRGVRQAFGVSARPRLRARWLRARHRTHRGPRRRPCSSRTCASRSLAAARGAARPRHGDRGRRLSALAGSPLLVAFVTPECGDCADLLQRVSALHGAGA